MAQSNQKSSESTQRLINPQSNDKPDWSSPICLELFNNDRCREAFTICDHSFWEICLQRALKIKLFCPLCRKYQGQDKHNNQNSEPIQLDENIPWNSQVVLAFYVTEEIDEEEEE